MKVEKIFSVFIPILLILWALSGCKESVVDPDPGPDPEVVELLTDGMWEKVDSTEERKAIFKYDSDYTGEMYMLWEGEWYFLYEYTWKLEDNSTKLFLTVGDRTAYAEIEKLTETELILHWENGNRHFFIKFQD